ncbi:ATP-binding protein [Amycolatopsis cynarae]|uniref:histidine kinase n=1 Tax=Amycolatopsis cynarae TaxID=2995223 RepID=A0ABY7BAK3_9PSEU|nr:ATP-binding protein [Amycolatopsis sp. HUAS 11-8]WAL67891.1 ATP-binding protein [Amycolatopsis sp. HUAS 11-8]
MSAREDVRPWAQRSPLSQALLASLGVFVVAGGLWSWAVFGTPAVMPAVAAVLAVALCVGAALAVYQARRTRSMVDSVSAMEAELTQLVDETLPLAVSKLRQGTPANAVLAALPQPTREIHRGILRTLVVEIGLGERQRAAAMVACANAAGRVQAMATSMLADLREMEERHSEEVLGDLLALDHSTAQVGRLADSIAVLAGARSGRRWTKPIVMESILRGAMGRIGAYQRVRVHSASGAAIAGYAAEDIMHTLAELMDNATKFSAPSEEVHVYVEELHNGLVVTIEDAGLGMKPQALERAKDAVSSSEPLDLAKLSGTRLGLAVVGSLARKHRLEVFFRPSSRGGTGVVVRVPSQLLAQDRGESVPAVARQTTVPVATTPAATATAFGAAQAETATAVDEEEQRLPKRRRGQTLASAKSPGSPKPAPAKPRTDAGARFGAFRHANRPKPTTPDTNTGDES